MQTAKVFNYGENRAVQLPKNFHLAKTEVVIKQLGNVILLMPVTYSHQGIKGLLEGIELETPLDREYLPSTTRELF